jgi:hypothetical protein
LRAAQLAGFVLRHRLARAVVEIADRLAVQLERNAAPAKGGADSPPVRSLP